MKCPQCLEEKHTTTTDSRPSKYKGRDTRRRRVYCEACDVMFTTYELTADDLLEVNKVDDDSRKVLAILNCAQSLSEAWEDYRRSITFRGQVAGGLTRNDEVL